MKNNSSTPLLSEVAYERILEALFDSRLPMGSRMNQGDLIKVTGVPVGPVRDALKLLESDGIVKVHPRSGIEVIRPSTELARATFQFRAMIERPAVRAFAMQTTETVLNKIDKQHAKVLEKLEAADSSENVAGAVDVLESAFHLPIVASLENELVDASYRRLRLMAQIVKVKAAVFPRAAMVSVNEHRAVLQACLQRDADTAEQLLAEHLTKAMNRNIGFS